MLKYNVLAHVPIDVLPLQSLVVLAYWVNSHTAMSLNSDLTIDAKKFDRKNIDQETLDFNAKLIKIWADGPRWYEVNNPPPLASLTFPPIYPL